jgi:uncharacterized protein
MGKSWSKNISKNTVIFIIAAVVLIFSLIFSFLPSKKTYPNSLVVTINDQNYYLEVASDKAQREKGLSERKELCSNCGMLFVFDREGIYPFWMKDTYIPLDLIWLNSQNKVVKIITVLETNSETTYSNQQLAKYVIELNANDVFKLNLKVGDIINLPDLHE